MRTIFFVVLSVILIVGLSAILFFSFSAKPATQQTGVSQDPFGLGSTGQLPVVTPPKTGSALSVAASDGGTIGMNDFLHASDVGQYPSGEYYLGYHSDPSTTTPPATLPPYYIFYESADQFFTIELLKEPVGEVRKQAEQYLMKELGISETDMCRLNYTLTTTNDVSQTYAGISLGFSFCPGAVQLPD